MDKEDVIYIHNEILLNLKKERNNEWICSTMGETRDYHTKWIKSDKERQISYDIAYMWNLKKKKIYKWNYIQNRNRHRKQIYEYQRGEWGEAQMGDFGVNRYAVPYIKQINSKNLLYSTGKYTQYFVMIYKRKESVKEYIYSFIVIYIVIYNIVN